MSSFVADNLVKNLSDSFAKDTSSNNYKLLQTEYEETTRFRVLLQALSDVLDIDNATGATLDLYGELVGQPRGSLTDEQYILMIKAKALRNLASGSYPSILNALAITFNCDPSTIYIQESEDPCKVQAVNLPIETIVKANLSTADALQIIEQLLPITVTLESYLFDGTFTFSDSENEYDESQGFCDDPNGGVVGDGKIGGYFGTTSGGTDVIIKPDPSVYYRNTLVDALRLLVNHDESTTSDIATIDELIDEMNEEE